MHNFTLQYVQREKRKEKREKRKQREKRKEKSKEKREKQRERELAKYVLFIPVNAKHIENIIFYDTMEKNRKYIKEALNVILMLIND